MKLFKQIFMGKEEIELLGIKVYNAAAKKGVLYEKEFNQITKGCTEEEKDAIRKEITEKYKVVFDDGVYVIKEKEESEDEKKKILSALIKPEYVNTSFDNVQIGTKYFSGLTCIGLPEQVTENWLSALTREKSDIDYTIFIEPSSVAILQTYLTNELKKIKNDLYLYQARGEDNPVLEQKRQEIIENLHNISKGTYRLYKTQIHIAAKGNDLESVKLLTRKINSSLKGHGIITKMPINYQEQLIKSILPTATNQIKNEGLLIPDNALAASFPFSSPFDDVDEEEGILLGWNENNLPIARNLWKEDSYSGCFLGATGRGKSYACKIFLDQEHTIRGTKIIVIDPAATRAGQPEYKRMCEKLGGDYISFSTDSKNFPSIMGLYSGNFLDDVFAIEHILSVMLGGEEGVNDAQKPWLERAILMAFEAVGINKDDKTTWRRKPPTLEHVNAALKKLLREARTEAARMSIEALISRMSRYVGKGMYSFINHNSKELEFNNNFVVFEFKNTPEEIKDALTAIVMNFVKAKAMSNLDKTLIVLEEAHLWLKHPVLADFLATMIVLIRKSNTGMILVLQDLGQLENCEQGETLLGNMQFAYLMGCKKNLIEKTGTTFNLNDVEKEVLVASPRGNGILLWGDHHYKINIKIDPETHNLITTNPEEVKRLEEDLPKEEQENFFKFLKKYIEEDDFEEAKNKFAQKILSERNKDLLRECPARFRQEIEELIEQEKAKLYDKKREKEKTQELLEFWLEKGKKNIMPNDCYWEIPEHIRSEAEGKFDVIKKAEQYYKTHPLSSKPLGLTIEEQRLYSYVLSKFKRNGFQNKKTLLQKKRSLYEKEDEIKKLGYGNKERGKRIVNELLKEKWYRKEELKDDEIKILKELGYIESKKDVYDNDGNLVSVIAKVEGRETLQHLTYKYLFKERFLQAQFEVKKEGNEIDVVIPIRNKKIAIEVQCSKQKKAELLRKVEVLNSFDYWIIACRKVDIKYYEQLQNEKGFVLTINQALKKVKELAK